MVSFLLAAPARARIRSTTLCWQELRIQVVTTIHDAEALKPPFGDRNQG